jgi:hypothetical protein
LKKQTILCVPGLFLPARTLWLPASYCKDAGYNITYVPYHSFWIGTRDGVEKSKKAILDLHEQGMHIYALVHSLGGLVFVQALSELKQAGYDFEGKVVFLGSPLGGSAIFRKILGTVFAPIIRKTQDILPYGVQDPGMGRMRYARIVGTKTGWFWNGMFPTFDSHTENDGQVRTEETWRPWVGNELIKEYLTHSELWRSFYVGRCAAHFFKHNTLKLN